MYRQTGGIMRYEIIGKNIEVTEGIRTAATDSLGDLEKYFNDKDVTARVVVRTYPVGQKVEVTLIPTKGHAIRQEVIHENLYAAIDMAGKKLENQIRKLKERVTSSKKRKKSFGEVYVENEIGQHKEKLREVTRRKKLENKPMTEEEAILQFEMSGHDFYVFEDFEVEITKIIYKRKDGQYGIIELEA